jgi:hypothetical protein
LPRPPASTSPPFHTEATFSSFITFEHRSGRAVVLATASDQVLAAGVSRHLGVFSDVFASDGVTNLTGTCPRPTGLSTDSGRTTLTISEISRADIPVWRKGSNRHEREFPPG